MDRKAAIATAFAVVLGIGSAIFAVGSNIGFTGVKTNVGKLTQRADVPGTGEAVGTVKPKPRVVTVYVTPSPAVQGEKRAVRYVDTTIRVPVQRPASVGGTSTSSGTASGESHDGEDPSHDGSDSSSEGRDD